MEYMRFSLFGLIKSVILLLAVSALCSCGDEPEEPVLYTTRNMSSSEYLAFAWHDYSSDDDSPYVAKGEEWYTSITGDGGIGQNPDKVWATISTRDSVIEVVPKLMIDGTSYSMFLGIDGWELYNMGDGYILDLTDDVLASIADRMRSKGVPPFHIERDEIANKSSEDVTVSLLSGDAVLNKMSIAVGETVALPSVGHLFDCDKAEVGTSTGTLATDRSEFVHVLESKSYRVDGGTTGYRQFYVTDNALKMLRVTTPKEP